MRPYNGDFGPQLLWTFVVFAVAVVAIVAGALTHDAWTLRRKRRRLDLKKRNRRFR